MDSHQQTLSRAWQHQNAGEPAQAEALCRQIVREDAGQPEAWTLLGVIGFGSGKLDAALDCFDRALALGPTVASYHSNRGIVLQALGRSTESEREFREALRIAPTHIQAYNNLGNVLREEGRFQESEACYRRAMELKPDYPDAWNNLGSVQREIGRYEEAAAGFRRALELKPVFPEALTNLGNVLRDLGKLEESEQYSRRALELRPAFPDALNNLGATLREMRRRDEAETCYRRTLEIRPDHPETMNNLAILLRELARLNEAEVLYRRALQLKPMFPEACTNLGNIYRDQGRYEESAASYRRAMELKPNYPEAHSCLAQLMLLDGDFEHGFAEYEWRLKIRDFKLGTYPQPYWDGSSLAGRTILLHPEQGLGDTLQFVRFAPLVKKLGATVLFHCPPPLLPLLFGCPGIDQIVPVGAVPPRFDVHAPLLSLPRLLGTRVATIPAAVPYLSVDSALVDRWRERLADRSGFKVGIVWQGNPKFLKDRQRSVPLNLFEPLSRVQGVRLFSLQVGPGVEQLPALGDRIIDLGSQFVASSFADAAAVVQNLDLAITVDTALGHLAGALAAPVWMILPFSPDWRWLLEREDCPWYPTMRLFRQGKLGTWDDVFERMTEELKLFSRER